MSTTTTRTTTRPSGSTARAFLTNSNQTTTTPAELDALPVDPATMSCLTCGEQAAHVVHVGAFGSVHARGFCERHYHPKVFLMRGGHVLPHQSQQVHRDLARELIRENLGATSYCYRLDIEQEADECDRYGYVRYRFLVRSPRSAALAWTAFEAWAEMVTWATAYAIEVPDTEPEPGERFTVTMPTDLDRIAPVRPAVTLYDWEHLHDDYKLGNTFAPRVLFLDPDSGATVLGGAHVLRYRPNV